MFKSFDSRKLGIVSISAVAVILLVLYLYAMFLPGLWFGDAFLYKQKDGSFAGSDYYADYKMTISQKGTESNITFAVNDIKKEYKVINNSLQDIKIFEDSSLIFEGNAIKMGDRFVLSSNDGDLQIDVSVSVGGEAPSTSEMFPSKGVLYSWATENSLDRRGNFYIFFLMLILGGVLALDTAFPDLFFTLKYSLAVYGGEPSDWYRAGQRFGRWLMGAGILVLAIMSFALH